MSVHRAEHDLTVFCGYSAFSRMKPRLKETVFFSIFWALEVCFFIVGQGEHSFFPLPEVICGGLLRLLSPRLGQSQDQANRLQGGPAKSHR